MPENPNQNKGIESKRDAGEPEIEKEGIESNREMPENPKQNKGIESGLDA